MFLVKKIHLKSFGGNVRHLAVSESVEKSLFEALQVLNYWIARMMQKGCFFSKILEVFYQRRIGFMLFRRLSRSVPCD